MQTKNKKNILIIFFLSFFIFNFNLSAEEFNITAKEVTIDNNNEILTGEGSVKAIDAAGRVITADKITYTKSKNFIFAEGKVRITDLEGNMLLAEKATYDKMNEIITTYDETKFFGFV